MKGCGIGGLGLLLMMGAEGAVVNGEGLATGFGCAVAGLLLLVIGCCFFANNVQY